MSCRGVSAIQDPFMKKAHTKLLASRKWPAEFSDQVDMTRISLDAIRPWIESRITQLLGDEDEIVNEYCIAQLEAFDPVDKTVDPREIQLNLEGFLGMEGGATFTWELWNLLLSAQLNSAGVPEQLIEQQRKESDAKQKEADRMKKEIEQKRESQRIENEQAILRREKERREEREGDRREERREERRDERREERRDARREDRSEKRREEQREHRRRRSRSREYRR